MKKISIVLVIALLLGVGSLLIFRSGLISRNDPKGESVPPAADAESVPAQGTQVEYVSDAAPEPAPTEEPVFVSDPIYGDELTEEELEAMREEDAPTFDSPGLYVGEEFVIELDENQGTDGF